MSLVGTLVDLEVRYQFFRLFWEKFEIEKMFPF